MKAIIYPLFLAALYCCQPTDRTSSDHDQGSAAVTKSHIDSVIMEISQTPDSLRTPEQKETIQKIHLMVAKYVELKDGVFSFALSKEEFAEKTGLEIEYYDVIIRNLRDNNAMTDQMNFEEVEKSFNKMKEQFIE